MTIPIRALMIDLSGTIHIGPTSTRNASQAIKLLRDSGIAIRWVSNTSKESRSDLINRMIAMDLDVRQDELFTSLSAVSDLVVARNLRPLLLLTPSAASDFPPSSPPFDSVVVGLAPSRLNYNDMNEAFRLLAGETTGRKDLTLLATHKALYYRSSDGELKIGPGPFISALEESTGISAEIVGKPSQKFFELALNSLERDGIRKDEWSSVGMIGDDKLQDVGSVASELKLQRFLVQTGKYRAGDEDAIKTKQGTIIESPEWCGQDFYAAVQYILQK